MYAKVLGGAEITKSEKDQFVKVFVLQFVQVVNTRLRKMKTKKVMNDNRYLTFVDHTDESLVFYMLKHYGIEGRVQEKATSPEQTINAMMDSSRVLLDDELKSKDSRTASETSKVPKLVGKKLEEAIEYFFDMDKRVMSLRGKIPVKRRKQINNWIRDAVEWKPAKEGTKAAANVAQHAQARAFVEPRKVDKRQVATLIATNPYLKGPQQVQQVDDEDDEEDESEDNYDDEDGVVSDGDGGMDSDTREALKNSAAF